MVVKVENVLIIGSGIMGCGIAQCTAMAGKFKSIVVQDISEKQLEVAKSQMAGSLQRMKKIKPELDVQAIFDRITWTTELNSIVDKNLLIIEAIPEKLELKQTVFKGLSETYANNDSVILTTNTSSLKCGDIGKYVKNKNKFAGLHFCNPVVLMKLVEIIRVDNGTDDETHSALVQYVKDIGKVGVTCKDTAGFILNRLLIPYAFDAMAIVERGDATVKDIDTAMKLGAGYPMGPFELIDIVGLDTVKFAGASFMEGDGIRICKASKLLNKLVDEGKLGKKSGQGFYDYNNNVKPIKDSNNNSG